MSQSTYLVAWCCAASGRILERAVASPEETASYMNTYRDRADAMEGVTMTFFNCDNQEIVSADSPEMFALRSLAIELNGGVS